MLCSRHNGDNKRKTRGRFGDRERQNNGVSSQIIKHCTFHNQLDFN